MKGRGGRLKGKRRVNLYLDYELFKEAKELGLSVSAVCERALRLRVEALKAAEERDRREIAKLLGRPEFG